MVQSSLFLLTVTTVVLCETSVLGQSNGKGILFGTTLVEIAKEAETKPEKYADLEVSIPYGSYGRLSDRLQAMRFSSLLPSTEIVGIRVNRYLSTINVSRLLKEIQTDRIEGPILTLLQGFHPILDFRLQFNGGESVRVLTDARLIALEDSKGRWWFYWTFPASFQKLPPLLDSKIVFEQKGLELDRSHWPASMAAKADPRRRPIGGSDTLA